MRDWKSVLEADPMEWLLEGDNPSVRYFTLTDLLGRPSDDSDVRRAKVSIMESGPVPKLLATQESQGHWGRASDFYQRSKYKGTVWTMLILAELGVDENDVRIRKACEFMLQNSQDPLSGGFSSIAAKSGGGTHNGVIPCLTGNMVWVLLRFGYLEDYRVKQGIDWIVKYSRFDDGENGSPKGWPYDGRDRCWGTHTCHFGVVKGLKALAEIPPDKRSKEVRSTIRRAAEHILRHHIHKRSHDLSKFSKTELGKFGFPLMWNTDALEILGILTKLGYNENRMQEAVDLVILKQNDEGKWLLESTFTGRHRVSLERIGKPSKWITLSALRVLKSYYG